MGETTELPRAERRRQLAGNTALGAGLAIFALAAAASGWWRITELRQILNPTGTMRAFTPIARTGQARTSKPDRRAA